MAAYGLHEPDDVVYDAIRASTSDVDAIAQHTGLKPENIRRVKNHIFHEQHLLDRYAALGVEPEWKRFDSHAGIAEAWKRLERGTFTDADLQLLRHETAEAWYMRRYGPGYDAAHVAAQRRFPSPF